MSTKYYNKLLSTTRYRGKRGSALMLVVILFLVISILSVAVLGVAATEHAQIIAEEKLDQAYYNARAVVQAAADWMYASRNARDQMSLVIPSRDFLGKTYAKTTSSQLNGHDYTLSIWRDTADADYIHIEAATLYQGLPGRAAMVLQETVSGYFLFEDAIYSKGPFGKSSGNSNIVNGSVATGASSIPDNLNVTGERTINKHYDFDDILPASDVVFPGKVENATLGNKSGTAFINNAPNLNAHYGTLQINDDVYIINTDADGNPQDVHILIEDFLINDSAVIYPTDYNGGYIYIYVSDYISADKKFGIEGNDAAPVVFLICSGTGDISFDGNPAMDVFLYGPDVNVEYGGTTVLNGAIIANVYGWNGNVTVTYRKPELEGTPFEALNQAQRSINVGGMTWKQG